MKKSFIVIYKKKKKKEKIYDIPSLFILSFNL